MRKASRITAAVLGLFAGGASIEHGVYEILQGNVRPEGLMISSMGPPCNPEAVWHRCEPAMTVLPSFLATGILATVIGAFFMLWALAFVQRRGGGLVLVLAAIPMLLFGGGIFPPLIGIVAGITGMRVRERASGGAAGDPGIVTRILSRLWPWSLILLSVWLLGQWLVGYWYNELLMQSGFFVPILIIGLLLLSPISAGARDALRRSGGRIQRRQR